MNEVKKVITDNHPYEELKNTGLLGDFFHSIA